jgi:microcystin-dependent protein
LLGTTYGGDGRTTFALPNLQGRIPLHVGSGFTQGEAGGEESHTLLLEELPDHSHLLAVDNSSATTGDPTGAFLAAAGVSNFVPPAEANGTLNPNTVGTTGESQPHENRSPFLTLTFVIALQGIFPSRN